MKKSGGRSVKRFIGNEREIKEYGKRNFSNARKRVRRELRKRAGSRGRAEDTKVRK